MQLKEGFVGNLELKPKPFIWWVIAVKIMCGFSKEPTTNPMILSLPVRLYQEQTHANGVQPTVRPCLGQESHG